MKGLIYRFQTTLVTLLLLLSLGCAGSSEIRGKVTAITDGDTIKVLINKQEERIRLNGIDCPERNQAFGTKAKEFVSDLVFGKTVLVESEEIDRYGRILGWVYLEDGRNVNEELLKAGLAWHYKQYNNDPRLAMMEMEARNAKRGLWVDPNPTPPWDFRRNKR